MRGLPGSPLGTCGRLTLTLFLVCPTGFLTRLLPFWVFEASCPVTCAGVSCCSLTHGRGSTSDFSSVRSADWSRLSSMLAALWEKGVGLASHLASWVVWGTPIGTTWKVSPKLPM